MAPAANIAPSLVVPSVLAPVNLGGELRPLEFVEEMLRYALKVRASSIHLKARGFPMLRVAGELMPISRERLVADDVQQFADALMMLAGQVTAQCEYPLYMERGWFRVTTYRERGNLALTLHCVHDELPTLAGLQIPSDWMPPPRAEGLILLGGSRRRELIAAMVHAQNQRASGHIVLLEDQPLYMHTDVRCLIAQQEVGVDVSDFAAGFSAALNVDPDWIALSDPADVLEAVAVAAEAGGRLILVAVDAEQPVGVIDHCMRMLPTKDRIAQRARLTRVIQSVITLGPSGPLRLDRDEARSVAWRPMAADLGG